MILDLSNYFLILDLLKSTLRTIMGTPLVHLILDLLKSTLRTIMGTPLVHFASLCGVSHYYIGLRAVGMRLLSHFILLLDLLIPRTLCGSPSTF
jgi:hypothetical protein